jgi:hypothetical protein
MGSEADEIFSSFQLTDYNKKKVNVVKEKLDRYFIPKRNDIIEHQAASFLTACHHLFQQQ